MANFKRGGSRRQIRCSLCTPYRWMGNHQGRFKDREEADRNRDILADEFVVTMKAKSPKKNWSRNKRIRSLRSRLTNLRAKKAELDRQRNPNQWTYRIRDDYDREIERCEQELAELGGLV